MQTLGRSGTLGTCVPSQTRPFGSSRHQCLSRCQTSQKRSSAVFPGVWTPELEADPVPTAPYIPDIQGSRANRVALPQRQKRRDSRRPPPPDLPSILYDQRIVYLGMPLVPAVTELIVAELLHLEKEGPRQPVEILINSTGTTRADGETIETINIGVAVGWSCIILASGRKGRRKSFPHSLAMLQQPRQPPTGQRQAIEVHVKWREVLGFKQDLLRYLSTATGWNVEKLDKDIQRALYMSPEDCIAYNVIDEIIMPDVDKLFLNEMKWRKSGRLEQRGRIAGWQREFEMAFRQLARTDLVEAMAEESRDARDDMINGLGIDVKSKVEDQLPEYWREKLAEGKVPMSKAGLEIMKRESERVRDKVIERRRKVIDYPPEIQELRKQRTEELLAPAKEMGLPLHDGQGLDIDYAAMFAELKTIDPEQYARIDIPAFVKKFIRGVKAKPQE